MEASPRRILFMAKRKKKAKKAKGKKTRRKA
jgi:hypothetical protein